ncbi:MAG: tetratricopeptide repeat protein, partial [Saprospiraceae bacterium]|nr:tetratricopeptide repeat protein [Saprospiraceae bacterium]
MKYYICILFSLLCVFGYSQSDTELKRRAKEFFTFNRYEDALKTLRNSRNLSRNDEEGRFLIALCLYHLNQLDEAADILNNLVANEKTLYPECWFYLGKIFHARHQFAEAGRYYKAYLKNIAPNDPNRRMVVDIIRRCANGQQYQYKLPEAYVENLGSQVNTFYDEFTPVLSVTYDDRLYFSSSREGSMGGKRNPQGAPDERFGQYFSDMYFCENEKGTWTSVQPMPIQMNSPRHEVLLDFNKEGTALIYFKGSELNIGEILVDTFRQSENRVLSSDPFVSPIDTRSGDQSPFFYNDTLILFASSRPGGYGGYDLYKISFKNNRWTTPQNLGSSVNTAYDETSPFLARDGKTLYFSSNYAERSIGG